MKKQIEQLISDNHNLIYGCASQYGIDVDEYYDILAIGLCKAAHNYNENQGSFSTCAYQYMLQEYKNEIKKLYFDKRQVAQNSISLTTLENNLQDIGDIDIDILNIEHDLIETLKTVLTPKQFKVAKLYSKGFTAGDIAKILNVSRQCINQYNKFIKKQILLIQGGSC